MTGSCGLRVRFVVPFFALAMIAVIHCGESTPTAPVQEQPRADRELGLLGDSDEPADDSILTAVELLNDPLLHLMLESLHDPVGAAAILSAIEGTRLSLEEGEIEVAGSQLESAHAAMVSYMSYEEIDDEDAIHLDAAETFLDEAESLIEPKKLPRKNNP